MEVRAAEISDILKKQIADFGAQADVAEIGEVLSVGDGVAAFTDWTMCRPVSLSNFQTVFRGWL